MRYCVISNDSKSKALFVQIDVKNETNCISQI